jgi:hypothetical protein
VTMFSSVIQGDSNMTGTDLCVYKPHKSQSHLNHLVHSNINTGVIPRSDVSYRSIYVTELR